MRMTATTVAKGTIDFTVADVKFHPVHVSVHHENSCKERMIVFHQ